MISMAIRIGKRFDTLGLASGVMGGVVIGDIGAGVGRVQELGFEGIAVG